MEQFLYAFIALCVLGLFLMYPWLLLILLLGILVIVILRDILRNDDFFTGEKQVSFVSIRLSIVNSIRKRVGKPTIRLIPNNSERQEAEMVGHANQLVFEVKDALKHSPMAIERRVSYDQQAEQVPVNIVQALWKLMRLRRIEESIKFDLSGQKSKEIQQMIKQLHAEMMHSLDILSSIPISLVRVELAHSDRTTDRLFADLSEINMRLRDLSAGYMEVKEQSIL